VIVRVHGRREESCNPVRGRGNEKKMKTWAKLSFHIWAFSLRAKMSFHVCFADVSTLIPNQHLTNRCHVANDTSHQQKKRN